jgi:hypothetical protein
MDNGFCFGDKVKIINPILQGMPEVDGYTEVAEVVGFEYGHVKVRCGSRILICYPEDLKRVE